MKFTNESPAMRIYREMMEKTYAQYIYHAGNRKYQALAVLTYQPSQPGSSLDEIMGQDSREILDKIKTTSLCIAYRIKIHYSIDSQFESGWSSLKNELVGMDTFYRVRFQGSERRRSTLISELAKVYKGKMEEELQCWKDLVEPMRYFVHLFHQYVRQRQEKKMIGEKEA